MSLETKKFLSTTGTTYLWSKIKEELAKKGKVDSVSAGDNSITINGSTTAPTIQVKISPKADNYLTLNTTTGEQGLYVPTPAAAAEYTVAKATTADEGFAASYMLMREGVQTGATINIPKDMVVSSGTVVTKSTSGAWGTSGTYIQLTLANASASDLYINAADLVEYVTSGSTNTDMVVLNINGSHQISATVTDGSITAAKLHTDVQTALNKATSAIQAVDITTGTANGTIAVKGTNVSVYGLGSAAYSATSAFDPSGAANDVYTAIVAMTTSEIDSAIAAAT